MFNLNKDAVDQNGFISLVSKGTKTINEKHERESRWIVSSLAVLSLLVVSLIANGSQAQTKFEEQQIASIVSYNSVV